MANKRDGLQCLHIERESYFARKPRVLLGSSGNVREATRIRNSAGEDGHQLQFCEVT
jgi:hypothetical protein